MASALVHGGITLASFTAEALASPAVLALAERVRFESDARLGMTSGIMRIATASGSIEIEVDRPRGNPDDPLPLADLRAKFVSCAGQAVRPFPPEAAEAIADEILAAAATPGLREPIGRWLAA